MVQAVSCVNTAWGVGGLAFLVCILAYQPTSQIYYVSYPEAPCCCHCDERRARAARLQQLFQAPCSVSRARKPCSDNRRRFGMVSSRSSAAWRFSWRDLSSNWALATDFFLPAIGPNCRLTRSPRCGHLSGSSSMRTVACPPRAPSSSRAAFWSSSSSGGALGFEALLRAGPIIH